MTTYKALQLGQSTPSGSNAFQAVVIPGSIALAAAVALASGDTLQLVKLPAYHVPVDLVLDVPDLDDGTPAILFRAGFIGNDTDYNDDDAFVTAGSTAGQAGGIVRANAVGFTNIKPAPVDRIIGITVNTSAAGDTPAACVIRATLVCRPQSISFGDV